MLRRRLLTKNDDGILWLYKDGDECTGVTGGWRYGTSDTKNMGTPYNTGNCLYLPTNRQAVGWYNRNYAYTNKQIDLTNYNQLCMKFDGYRKYNTAEDSYSIGLVVTTTPATGGDNNISYDSEDYHPFSAYSRLICSKNLSYSDYTNRIDISTLSGSYVIEAINQINNEMKIYAIWIE